MKTTDVLGDSRYHTDADGRRVRWDTIAEGSGANTAAKLDRALPGHVKARDDARRAKRTRQRRQKLRAERKRAYRLAGVSIRLQRGEAVRALWPAVVPSTVVGPRVATDGD